MARKRVHEIAKQRGVPSKEILAALQAAGTEVTTASSSVEEKEAERVLGGMKAEPEAAAKLGQKTKPKPEREPAAEQPGKDHEAQKPESAEQKSAQPAEEPPGEEKQAKPVRPVRERSGDGGGKPSGGKRRRRVVIDSQAARRDHVGPPPPMRPPRRRGGGRPRPPPEEPEGGQPVEEGAAHDRQVTGAHAPQDLGAEKQGVLRRRRREGLVEDLEAARGRLRQDAPEPQQVVPQPAAPRGQMLLALEVGEDAAAQQQPRAPARDRAVARAAGRLWP